jgi:hypothetical protein
MDEHVADVEFTDGVWRPVYQQPDGRQYVIDASGEPVYGVWYIPPRRAPAGRHLGPVSKRPAYADPVFA